jgi:hypothetical protein
LYGDPNRSPARDDRQDGAAPQPAPWDTGHDRAPAPHEDLKVAGAPNNAPPGGPDGGFYDAGVYETTSYDTAASGPGTPGTPDGNATVAYDMGNAHGQGMGHAAPSEAGATSTMVPFPGADSAGPARDFEDMRRTPHASNRRLIRFAAIAAVVAVVGGGGVAWAVTSGSSSDTTEAPQRVQAQPPAPAPLTDAQRKDAADKRRKELKKRASRAAREQVSRPRLMAKGTPPPTPTPKKTEVATAGNPVPAGEAQKIARSLLPGYGWSPSTQFGCLVNLWNKESGWNVHAANPSGAYGIPQALPGSKMSTAGPDWQNNATTQIKWGLNYIKSRYSSPCGAWEHSQSTGWY